MIIDPQKVQQYLKPYLDHYTDKGINVAINDNLLKRVNAYNEIVKNEEQASLLAFNDVATQFGEMIKSGKKVSLEQLPLNTNQKTDFDSILSKIEEPYQREAQKEQEVYDNAIFKNDPEFLKKVQNKMSLMPDNISDDERLMAARLITAREEKGEELSLSDATAQIYYYGLLPKQINEKINKERKNVEAEPTPIEIGYNPKTGEQSFLHSKPEKKSLWDYIGLGEKQPYDDDLFAKTYLDMASKNKKMRQMKSFSEYESTYSGGGNKYGIDRLPSYMTEIRGAYNEYKNSLSPEEQKDFEYNFKKQMGNSWKEKNLGILKNEVSKSYNTRTAESLIKGVFDGMQFTVMGEVMPDKIGMSIDDAGILSDMLEDPSVKKDVEQFKKNEDDTLHKTLRQTTQSLTFIATSMVGSKFLFGTNVLNNTVKAITKGAKVAEWFRDLGLGFATGVGVGAVPAFLDYVGSPYAHNEDKKWWQKLGRGAHESILSPGLELATEAMFGSWTLKAAKSGLLRPLKAATSLALGVTQEVVEEEISGIFDDLIRQPDIYFSITGKLASGQYKDEEGNFDIDKFKEQFIIAASTLLSFGLFKGVSSAQTLAFRNQWGELGKAVIERFGDELPFTIKENIAKKLNVSLNELSELRIAQSKGINSYVNNLLVLYSSLSPEKKQAYKEVLKEQYPEVTDELTLSLLAAATEEYNTNPQNRIAEASISTKGIIEIGNQLKSMVKLLNQDKLKIIDDIFKSNDNFKLEDDEAEKVKEILYKNLPSVLGDYETAMKEIRNLKDKAGFDLLPEHDMMDLNQFIKTLYAEDKTNELERMQSDIELNAKLKIKELDRTDLNFEDKALAIEYINSQKEEALKKLSILSQNLTQIPYSLYEVTTATDFKLNREDMLNFEEVREKKMMDFFGAKRKGYQNIINNLVKIAESGDPLLGREYNELPIAAQQLLKTNYGYFGYEDKLRKFEGDIAKQERQSKKNSYKDNYKNFANQIVTLESDLINELGVKDFSFEQGIDLMETVEDLLDGKIQQADAVKKISDMLQRDTESDIKSIEKYITDILEEQKIYKEANKPVKTKPVQEVKLETKPEETKTEAESKEKKSKKAGKGKIEITPTALSKWNEGLNSAYLEAKMAGETTLTKEEFSIEYEKTHPKPVATGKTEVPTTELALLNFLTGLQNMQGLDNWEGAREYVEKNIRKDATLKQIHEYADKRSSELAQSVKIEPKKDDRKIDKTELLYKQLEKDSVVLARVKEFIDKHIIPRFVDINPSVDREYNYQQLSKDEIEEVHRATIELFKDLTKANLEFYAKDLYSLIRLISNFRGDVTNDNFFLMSPAIRSSLIYSFIEKLNQIDKSYLDNVNGDLTGDTYLNKIYKYIAEVNLETNSFDNRYKHLQYHYTDARSYNPIVNQVISLLGFLNPLAREIHSGSFEFVESEILSKLENNVFSMSIEDKIRILQALEDFPAFFNVGEEIRKAIGNVLFNTKMTVEYQEFLNMLNKITGVPTEEVESIKDEKGEEQVGSYNSEIQKIEIAKQLAGKSLTKVQQQKTALHEYTHLLLEVVKKSDGKEAFYSGAMKFIERVQKYIETKDTKLIKDEYLSRIDDINSLLASTMDFTNRYVLNISNQENLVDEFYANFMGNNISISSLMYVMKPIEEVSREESSLLEAFFNFSFTSILKKLNLGMLNEIDQQNLANEFVQFSNTFYKNKIREAGRIVDAARSIQYAAVVEDDTSEEELSQEKKEYVPFEQLGDITEEGVDWADEDTTNSLDDLDEDSIDPEHDFMRREKEFTPHTLSRLLRGITIARGEKESMDIYEIFSRMTEEEFISAFTIEKGDTPEIVRQKTMLDNALANAIPYKGISNFNLTKAEIKLKTLRGLYVRLKNTKNRQYYSISGSKILDPEASEKVTSYKVKKQPAVFKVKGVQHSSVASDVVIDDYAETLNEQLGIDLGVAFISDYNGNNLQMSLPWIAKDKVTNSSTGTIAKILWANNLIYLLPFADKSTVPIFSFDPTQKEEIFNAILPYFKVYQLFFGTELFDESIEAHKGLIVSLTMRLLTEELKYGNTPKNLLENRQSAISKRNWREIMKRHVPAIHKNSPIYGQTVSNDIKKLNFIEEKPADLESLAEKDRPAFFYEQDKNGVITETYIKATVLAGENNPSPLFTNKFGKFRHDGATFGIKNKLGVLINTVHGSMNEGANKDYIVYGNVFGKHSEQFIDEDSEGGIGNAMANSNIGILLMNSNEKNNLKGAGIPLWDIYGNEVGNLAIYKPQSFESVLAGTAESFYIPLSSLHRIGAAHSNKNETNGLQQSVNSSGITTANKAVPEDLNKYVYKLAQLLAKDFKNDLIERQDINEKAKLTGHKKEFVDFAKHVIKSPQGHLQATFSDMFHHLKDEKNNYKIWNEVSSLMYHESVYSVLVDYLGTKVRNLVKMTHSGNMLTLHSDPGKLAPTRLKIIKEDIANYIVIPKHSPKIYEWLNLDAKARKLQYEIDFKTLKGEDVTELRAQVKVLNNTLFKMGDVYAEHNRKMKDNPAYKEAVEADITKYHNRFLDENGFLKSHTTVIDQKSANRLGVKVGDTILPAILPTDSAMGLYSATVIGIIPNDTISDSAIILPSEYVQLVGKDFDLDKIIALTYDPRYLSIQDWKNLARGIEQMQKNYLEEIVKTVLKDRGAFATDENIKKAFKGLLKFNQELYGEQKTNENISPFSADAFRLADNYSKRVGYVVILRQLHQYLGSIGLKVSVGNKYANQNPTKIFEVDFGDENLWFKNHIGMLKLTNDQVDYPNPMDKDFYNHDLKTVVYAMFGLTADSAKEERKAVDLIYKSINASLGEFLNIPRFNSDRNDRFTRVQNTSRVIANNENMMDILIQNLEFDLGQTYSAVNIETEQKLQYPLEGIVNQVARSLVNANFYSMDYDINKDIIKNLTRKTEFKVVTDIFPQYMSDLLGTDFMNAVMGFLNYGISQAEVEVGVKDLRRALVREWVQIHTGREARPKEERFNKAEEKYMAILGDAISNIKLTNPKSLIPVFPFNFSMQNVIDRALGLPVEDLGIGEDQIHDGNLDNLDEDSILVFGSNVQGLHGKGSALLAATKYGAVKGINQGLQGHSYAIITKNLRGSYKEQLKSIPLSEILKQVTQLYSFALENPNLKFYVPYSGTKANLNGYTPAEMADVFGALSIPSNIIFEKTFKNLIELRRKEILKKQKGFLKKDNLGKYILLTNNNEYLSKKDATQIKIINNLNNITIDDISQGKIVLFDEGFEHTQIVDHIEKFSGGNYETMASKLRADIQTLLNKTQRTREEDYRLNQYKKSLTVLESEKDRINGRFTDLSDLFLRTNQVFGFNSASIDLNLYETFANLYFIVTGKTEIKMTRVEGNEVAEGEEVNRDIERRIETVYEKLTVHPIRDWVIPKMLRVALDNPNYKIYKSNMPEMAVYDLNSDYKVKFDSASQMLILMKGNEVIEKTKNYKSNLKIYNILMDKANYKTSKQGMIGSVSYSRRAELNRFSTDAAFDFAHHNNVTSQDRMNIAGEYLDSLTDEQKKVLPKVFTLMMGIPSTKVAALNLYGFGHSTANENLYRLMARYTPKLWREYLQSYSKYNNVNKIMYASVVEDEATNEAELNVAELLGIYAEQEKISTKEFSSLVKQDEKKAIEMLKKLALDTDIRFEAAKLGKNYNEVIDSIESGDLRNYQSILGLEKSMPTVAKQQVLVMIYRELKSLGREAGLHKNKFHLENFLGVGRKTLSSILRRFELPVYNRFYYNPANPLFYTPNFKGQALQPTDPIAIIDVGLAATAFDPNETGLRPFGNLAVYYHNVIKLDQIIQARITDINKLLNIRGSAIFKKLLGEGVKDPDNKLVKDEVIDRQKFEARVWWYEQLLNEIHGLVFTPAAGSSVDFSYYFEDNGKRKVKRVNFNLLTGEKLYTIVNQIFSDVEKGDPSMSKDFAWLKDKDNPYDRAALAAAIQSKVVYHAILPTMIDGVHSYLTLMKDLIKHPTYKLEIGYLIKRYERYKNTLKVNTTEEKEYVELSDGRKRILRKFSPVVFDREKFIEEFLENHPDKTYEDAVKITGFDTYYIPFFHNNIYSNYTRGLNGFNKDTIFISRLMKELSETLHEVNLMAYHNNALSMGENQKIINVVMNKAQQSINPLRLVNPTSIRDIPIGKHIIFFTFETSEHGNSYIKNHFGELTGKTADTIIVTLDGEETTLNRADVKTYNRDLREFDGVGYLEDSAIVADKTKGRQLIEKANYWLRDMVGVSILGGVAIPRSVSVNLFGSFFQALQEHPSFFPKVFTLSPLGDTGRVENADLTEALKYISALGSVTLDVFGDMIDTEYSYYQEVDTGGKDRGSLSKTIETLKIFKEVLKDSLLERQYQEITSKLISRLRELTEEEKKIKEEYGMIYKGSVKHQEIIKERQFLYKSLKLLKSRFQFTAEEIDQLEDEDVKAFFRAIQNNQDIKLYLELHPKTIKKLRKAYLYRKFYSANYAGMRAIEKFVRPKILSMGYNLYTQHRNRFAGMSDERALRYANMFVLTTQGHFKWYQERMSKKGSLGSILFLLHSFTLHALDRISRVIGDAEYTRLLYGLKLNSYFHHGYIVIDGKQVALNPQQNLMNMLYINMVLFNLSSKIWGLSFLMNPVLYPFFFTIKYLLDALDPDDGEDTVKSFKFTLMSWIQLMIGWGGAIPTNVAITLFNYKDGDWSLLLPRNFKDPYGLFDDDPQGEVTGRNEKDEQKNLLLDIVKRLTGFSVGKRFPTKTSDDIKLLLDFVIPFRDDLEDLFYDNEAAKREKDLKARIKNYQKWQKYEPQDMLFEDNR